MKFLSRRKILLAIFATLFFIIFSVGVVLLKYFLMTSEKAPEKITLKPAGKDFKIGDRVEFFSEFECDWTVSPKRIDLILPEGLQLVDKERFFLRGIKWGSWKWGLKVWIQPYRAGDFSNLSGYLIFSTKDDNKKEAKLELPNLDISEIQLPPDAEVKIADKIEIGLKRNWKKILTLIVLISLVGVAVWLSLRRLRKNNLQEKKELPIWALALDALRELRNSHEKGLLDGEQIVVRLTDIIRGYLEKRFGIEAPNMTTNEFLLYMRRDDNPILREYKDFLSEFMESADLIKFAKVPADSALVMQAIEKAEALVRATVVSPNKGEEEKKKQ